MAEGPVILYFEDDERESLNGEILSTSDVALDEITPSDLRVADADAVEKYVAGLRRHYPEMPDDAVVTVVDFTVGPSRASMSTRSAHARDKLRGRWTSR